MCAAFCHWVGGCPLSCSWRESAAEIKWKCTVMCEERRRRGRLHYVACMCIYVCILMHTRVCMRRNGKVMREREKRKRACMETRVPHPPVVPYSPRGKLQISLAVSRVADIRTKNSLAILYLHFFPSPFSPPPPLLFRACHRIALQAQPRFLFYLLVSLSTADTVRSRYQHAFCPPSHACAISVLIT